MAELNYQNGGQTEDSFDAIPAGDYPAMIIESERVASKTNPQNSYLKLKWEILEGQYRGRKLFENVNLWNTNGQAVEIARKAMDSICTSCGFTNGVKSSEELHRKPVMLKVGVREKKDANKNIIPNEYENHIKKHSPATGGQPAMSQAQPTPGAMPWQK